MERSITVSPGAKKISGTLRRILGSSQASRNVNGRKTTTKEVLKNYLMDLKVMITRIKGKDLRDNLCLWNSN